MERIQCMLRCMSRRPSQLRNLLRYNLSEEDFEALLEVQDYACAICRMEEEQMRADGSDRLLSIDHCHKVEDETGEIKVRGLLCSKCNIGLSMFRDSPTYLSRAIEYLGGNFSP